MIQYLKTYLISISISIFFAFIPWLLRMFGLTYSFIINYILVLLGAFVGLVLSFSYIKRNTETRMGIVIMGLLNPVIYYLVAIHILFYLIRGLAESMNYS